MNPPAAVRSVLIPGVLALATVHAYFDRQILAVLAQPIKHALSLSNLEFSYVGGLAFGLAVALAMVPAGILADRGDRVLLLGGGITLWSMMTIYCGFADSFQELFVGRLGVGLGEAAMVPTVYSLVGEFKSRYRGIAVAVIVSSAPVGMGLASFLGGPLYQAIERHGGMTIGERQMSAWQLTLICTGLLGLLLAMACLRLPEPRRRAMRVGQVRQAPSVPLAGFLKQKRELSTYLVSGFCLFTMTGFGAIAWGPTLLTRDFSWTPASAGILLGGFMIASGIIGAQLAGWLAYRGSAKGRDRSAETMAFACILLAVLFAGMLVLPSGIGAAFTIGCIPFFLYGSSTLFTNLVLRVSPTALHARLSALLALIFALSGPTLGPTVFAFFGDRVFHGDVGLRHSLGSVGCGALLLAALCFRRSSRALSREDGYSAGAAG